MGGCPLSEKVFLLLMGCSKNYIMYWGLPNKYTTKVIISVHKIYTIR